MRWIEILSPAPVLNTPDFHAVFGGATGHSLPVNAGGHPIHYEFVALPGMRFELLSEEAFPIATIRWTAYSSAPLYVDYRFCRICSGPRPDPICPYSPQKILERMEYRLGTSYVWGGNYADGIPKMLEYYPPKQPLSPRTEQLWTFRGLDCSGLLFEASDGTTPRNTSHLLHYGRSLHPHESMQPLDMIIHPGHVLFIRDLQTTIESRFPIGVQICTLEQRLDELLKTRRLIREWNVALDPTLYFTIRRFL